MHPIALRIVATAGVVLVLWLATHAVKGRMVKDETDFTLAFVEAVKQRWPAARVEVHAPLHLQVETERSGVPDEVSLGDAYLQYRARPARLDDLMQERLLTLERARASARSTS